jgi:hypothetical protein
MNTRITMLLGTAFALTVSFGAAQAGSSFGVPAAPRTVAAHAYDIQLSEAPEAGKSVTVRLIDPATGNALAGGSLAVERPVYVGLKAAPMIQEATMPLPSQGDGFVCSGTHHAAGGRVTLRASLPGQTPVWRRFDVQG